MNLQPGSLMTDGSLRRVLMIETRDLHDRLDQAIGVFGEPADYCPFLSGSYAFRVAIEPVLPAHGWRRTPLTLRRLRVPRRAGRHLGRHLLFRRR